ncbi:hypothetical protein KSC_072000 [Ktedonobacter sp. SOSP1-52]|nr:hypothetical protein KSC_072000 [Ktedonobacter sp. SOSP1-52]
MKTWVERRYPARVKEVKASARQLVRLVANDAGYGTRDKPTWGNFWRRGPWLGSRPGCRYLHAAAFLG